MGKSRDWMYSTVETTGQVTSGYNQYSAGQSAISKYFLFKTTTTTTKTFF